MTPPAIPDDLLPYNTYVEDPKWQTKFTIIWVSALGFTILVSLPHLVRSIRQRRAFTGLFGIWESLDGKGYQAVHSTEKPIPPEPPSSNRSFTVSIKSIRSVLLWAPPGLELDAGQIFLIAGYLTLILICLILKAPLMENPNRPGFIALAQFPVVFLFATKNSLLSLALGPGNGYEKLNFIHRWSGRAMFLSGGLHGVLWIRNHIIWDLQIIGAQKESSGVAAFGLLCVIVLSSLKPVRKYCYEVFFIIHILAFVAFFVTICYHTIYARPWIFPPIALYGLDMIMRMLRYRIKDATLVSVDNNMTLIRISNCDGGWTAGQHIQLRVFFSGRVFESHPLTILNAPPASSCLSTQDLILGSRVCGDWSRALNTYAGTQRSSLCEKKSSNSQIGTPIQVMIDGPYGGCSVELGHYENVLLLAGGSGATFTLGLLDDIVARCVKLGRRNGERTKRIEFAWCVKSFGSIEWFAPMLMDIAKTATGTSLDLHLSIFVTCLCNPEAVPPIPNLDVTIERPSVQVMVRQLVTPPEAGQLDIDLEDRPAADFSSPRAGFLNTRGGVAICASGPASLTREAQNAVARLGAGFGRDVGGIALHTELFSM